MNDARTKSKTQRLGHITLLVLEQMGIADLALLPGNGFRFLTHRLLGFIFTPHRLPEIAETDLVVSKYVHLHRSYASFFVVLILFACIYYTDFRELCAIIRKMRH